MQRTPRRPINWNGPPLALLTCGTLVILVALAVGAAAGVEQCGYAIVLLIGLAAIAGRVQLAEINRRLWTGIVGGTGDRFAAFWRGLWFVWGLLAALGGGVGLVGSMLRAVS